jgi:outer membrane receptor for ferrienterochelin and colicin
MAKYFLVLSVVFFAFSGQAQTAPQPLTIKGISIDSVSGEPLAYVTVILQLAPNAKPIKKVVTKSDGSFVITGPAGNAYTLVLTSVGYTDKVISISKDASTVDAGRLLLTRSATHLKAASVTAAKPIVTREVDKLNYDVQADPEVASLSVLDMMRKVPMLTVDGDDHLLLNGGGNYKVLINGKESAMMARNPSDILKAMPATNIERIEVITTPPAKYDAEGLSGIINIITKRRADEGYNVGLNGAYNSVFGPNGGFFSTYKQGKFGLAAYGFYSDQINMVTHSSTTEYLPATDNTITQHSLNSRHGRSGGVGVDLSYEFDSLHLLTVSGNYYQATTYTGNIQSSQTDSAAFTQQGYGLSNNYKESYLGLTAGANYQLGFKRSKKEFLTFSYEFNEGPDEKVITDSFYDRLNYDALTYPNYQQFNNENITTNTVQLDFEGPLSKQLSMEAGAKAIFRNDHSYFHQDDQDSAAHSYLIDEGQTNNFTYLQDVYSLYNSYQLKLKNWTGKGGLRLEHTAVDANFTSEQVAISPNYTNLIPSISLQRNFGAASVNLGYTQRIQRPGISQLSPYVNLSNPLFVVTGNPSLRPELDNTFELTYNKFGRNTFIAGVNYAFSNNSIQRISSLQVDSIDHVKDTVNYTTYGNLGSYRRLGINLNTRLNPGKAFSVGLNAQLSHLWLEGSGNGIRYKNDGYFGNAFVNARYALAHGYAVSVNGGYASGNITLQGHTEGQGFSNYAVSKEFLKKKATLTLGASNFYQKYLTLRSTTNGADFSQVSYNQQYFRKYFVRFNYRFGKLNSEIKKNQHGINNDDLKQVD